MTPGMPASPSPHSSQAEARTTPAHLAEATAPNLWRRMACWLYEGMLMFGVVFIAGYLFGTLSQTRNAMDNRHALQVFLFVVFGIYFTWFWAQGRQTLAMKTWQLHVVRQDGAPLSQGRALARYAAAWLWFLPALAVLGWTGRHSGAEMSAVILAGMAVYLLAARLHPSRQYLHDLLCGTRLERRTTGPAAKVGAGRHPQGSA